MQNIPRWKKSERGSSHFRHGLDPRLELPVNVVIIVRLAFFKRFSTLICPRTHVVAFDIPDIFQLPRVDHKSNVVLNSYWNRAGDSFFRKFAKYLDSVFRLHSSFHSPFEHRQLHIAIIKFGIGVTLAIT